MTTITITNYGEQALYLIIFLLCAYILYKYQKKFNKENLVSHLIYITNKVMLILLCITFLLSFLYTIVTNEYSKVELFLKETTIIFIYYIIVNYGIFYGLRLISNTIDFFRDQDLMDISYLKKKGVNKKR